MTRRLIVGIGDGTRMGMNSDIYSSLVTGHKMIVMVPENGEFEGFDGLLTVRDGPVFSIPIGETRLKERFPLDRVELAKAIAAFGVGWSHRANDRSPEQADRDEIRAKQRIGV